MRTSRTPATAGILFLALLGALINPVRYSLAQGDEKKDTPLTAKADPDTMKKLVKVGDKVVLDADGGKIAFDLYIGGTKYPVEAHVGDKGRMQWSLEEMENAAGKKVPALVIRFDRPDKDNASIMAKKLLPRIKQIPFVVEDKDSGFGGTVYTGNDAGDDEPEDGKVTNRFDHKGQNGDQQTGPYFWVTPKYKDGDVVAQGTRGIFISPNPLPAKFKSAGIVIGLAEWEPLKK
ncbi:MAG TPA: hypothetical protein PKV72_01130 [Candidatus Peribacteria bacterium]|nr:hypothetical protein [Candidatus Peribacteria bacterium]